MTTVNEKLLARAEEYEAKARALRFAAAEMTGVAVNGKQKTAAGTLDAAIALRQAQRNGNGHAPTARGSIGRGRAKATSEDRQTTIRAFLQRASPQTTLAIHRQLEVEGQGCSLSWTLKMLGAMKDVHLVGRGAKSAWGLGKAKRAAPGSRLAEKRAVRERTAKVLDAYDREKPRQPVEIAKSFGLTVAKSGFAPLVHQGYLRKKGKDGGYIRTAKPYVIETAPAAADA